MYLQLAENNLSAKVVKVRGYKRSPRVASHTRAFPRLSANAPANINHMIFVPDLEAGRGGVWVREDKFDAMPHNDFIKFMKLIAPYQPANSGLNEGLSKGWLEKSQERKTERMERKQDRKDAKEADKEANPDRQGGNILKNVVGSAANIAGSIFGGKPGMMPEEQMAPPPKPFYKNPIVLGVGAVALLGGLYLITKK